MRGSLGLKLFLSHVFAVLLVAGSVGALFFSIAYEISNLALRDKLQTAVAIASQSFDANDLRKIESPSDVRLPEYRKALTDLRNMERINPDIAFLYIMKRKGSSIAFVVDSDYSDKQALPGQEYTAHMPEMVKGFSSIAVDKEILGDQWGHFLSAYAPIKNGFGEFLVGVDMRADEIYAKFHRLRVAAILSLVGAVLTAFLFSRAFSGWVIRPIRMVLESCSAIARGNLSHRIAETPTGEFAKLVSAVNNLASSLEFSEKKKQEAFTDLQRSRDELEIRVKQRTMDLREVNNKLSYEISQRIIAQQALQEAATIDPLTGLYNRRAILDRIKQEFARNKRYAAPFSIIVADIDHFKGINDSKGHDAGDSVLVEMSVRMRGMLRSMDALARWGGEEFLLLLPDTTLENGMLVAEKIRSRICDSPFFVRGEELHISSSFGVAEHEPDMENEALIKKADEALYRAKELGRNRSVAAPRGE